MKKAQSTKAGIFIVLITIAVFGFALISSDKGISGALVGWESFHEAALEKDAFYKTTTLSKNPIDPKDLPKGYDKDKKYFLGKDGVIVEYDEAKQRYVSYRKADSAPQSQPQEQQQQPKTEQPEKEEKPEDIKKRMIARVSGETPDGQTKEGEKKYFYVVFDDGYVGIGTGEEVDKVSGISKKISLTEAQFNAIDKKGKDDTFTVSAGGSTVTITSKAPDKGKKRTSTIKTVDADGSSETVTTEEHYWEEKGTLVKKKIITTTEVNDKGEITKTTETSVWGKDEGKQFLKNKEKYSEKRDEKGKLIEKSRTVYRGDKLDIERTTVYDANDRPKLIIDSELGTAEWQWDDAEKKKGHWKFDGPSEKREELEKLANKKLRAYKWASTITDVFTVLQSRGVGKFVGLFMDDDAFSDWRESVDEFFCSTIIGGGIECWTSEICSAYSDMTGDGYVSIEAPSGLLEIAAHVEGEKMIVRYANETGSYNEYLYKISFSVKNPEDNEEDMIFNVFLIGDKKVKLYDKDIKLEEGETFQRRGSAMIVQYSYSNYNKVCVVFDEDLYIDGGRKVKSVCNSLNEYSGKALGYKEGVKKSGGSGSDNNLDQEENDF